MDPNQLQQLQQSTITNDRNTASVLKHSTAEGMVSYTRNSNAIKPSVSFMNLSRDQAKLKHFVDLQDGPSSLQKRDQVATLKEKS